VSDTQFVQLRAVEVRVALDTDRPFDVRGSRLGPIIAVDEFCAAPARSTVQHPRVLPFGSPVSG
jgi:hypothetical protein